jgi:hypothetical protein
MLFHSLYKWMRSIASPFLISLSFLSFVFHSLYIKDSLVYFLYIMVVPVSPFNEFELLTKK